MQNDSPPAPPMAPTATHAPVGASATKSSSGLRWLLIGGAGLFALVVLCAGGFVWFYMSSQTEVEQVVNSFQAQLDAEDYAAAYRTIGPELKAMSSKADFTDIESTILKQLGKLQSKTLQSFNVQESTTGGSATIVYHCTYKKGQGQVKYTLSKSTGLWRVIGHHVESSALLKILTCPSCGKVMNDFPQFCSGCGAKLNR